MNHLMRDIASCERPYEKALAKGIEALSDAELLSVIIRSGSRDESALTLAHRILNLHPLVKGPAALNFLCREELCKLPGIGSVKATQLLAVAELSARIREYTFRESLNFSTPETVGQYYMQKCRFSDVELVFVMYLTAANTLLSERLLSRGTVDMALVSPREVYIDAMRLEAKNILLVHNHPSGNPNPSEQDLQITKQLVAAGMLLDIRLLDHIIVSRNSYISLREKGVLH